MSRVDRLPAARAFGAILRTARMGAGMSQHEVAQTARVARNFPGRLERGVQQPTLSTIIALAEALGVPPTMLLSMTVGRMRRLAGGDT